MVVMCLGVHCNHWMTVKFIVLLTIWVYVLLLVIVGTDMIVLANILQLLLTYYAFIHYVFNILTSFAHGWPSQISKKIIKI